MALATKQRYAQEAVLEGKTGETIGKRLLSKMQLIATSDAAPVRSVTGLCPTGGRYTPRVF